MVALSWGGSWLLAVVVFVFLVWATGMTLVMLSKILACPERTISVRIRLFPWPRIEIDAER